MPTLPCASGDQVIMDFTSLHCNSYNTDYQNYDNHDDENDITIKQP